MMFQKKALRVILGFCSMSLISCSGSIKDPFIDIGDSADGTLLVRPTPSPTPTGTPGQGGDGTGGDCYEIPSIGRYCDGDGGIFGNDQGTIKVKLLNFNGGEFVRGGGNVFVKYRANVEIFDKFKSVYSKIEVKKKSDENGPWQMVGEKITSNDGEIVEFEWKVCPHLEVESCERNPSGELVPVNGSDFQIRVTSNRLASQSGSVSSTGQFTIDSEAPLLVIAEPTAPTKGFFVSATQSANPNGFVNLELKGASDNLSAIKFLCLKSTFVAPQASDGCWTPISTFNPSESTADGRKVISISSLPLFLGFGAVKINYYLWLMDFAGNISQLHETLVNEEPVLGLKGKDLVQIDKPAVPNVTNALFEFNDGSLDFKTAIPTAPLSNDVDKNQLTDPGSLVITASGFAYIKVANQGILKLDLKERNKHVLVPVGPHKDGSVDGVHGTARVNDPLRIALDDKEDLWVMDKHENGKVIISKITNLSKLSPGMVDLIGMAATSDENTDMKAEDLRITYSDNLRWYGTFVALPDGLLAFSSEDPIRPFFHDSPTAKARLRVYRPERELKYQIQTLTFNTKDAKGAEATSPEMGTELKKMLLYGAMAVSFNWDRRDVGTIYGRACAPKTDPENSPQTCSELTNVSFEANGPFNSFIATPGLWMWGNELLFYSRQQDLLSVNSFRGRVSTLKGASPNSNWVDLFSSNGAGTEYCPNGTVAGQCPVRLRDLYMSPSGRIYFIDEQRLRFIDDDGRVQSILVFQ